MEQLDENFVGSTWVESRGDPRGSAAGRRAGMSEQQQAAIDGSQGRAEAGADPQPRGEGAAQRPLPLRQREEVQELLHAVGSVQHVSDRQASCVSVRERNPACLDSCHGCSISPISRCCSSRRRGSSGRPCGTASTAKGSRAKLLGPRAAARRRSAVRLAARGERRRGESAGDADRRARRAAARLGDRHLDDDQDRLRPGAQEVRRSHGVLLPARFQLGRRPRRCGACGRRCWCWPSWSCGRT